MFEYYEYMWGGFDDAGYISAIEKVDDFTVKCTRVEPLAPFLANLGMDFASVMSAPGA